MRLSPMLGSALSMDPAWDPLSLFLPPSANPTPMRLHTLSLSKKKKKKKNIYIYIYIYIKQKENSQKNWTNKIIPIDRISQSTKKLRDGAVIKLS